MIAALLKRPYTIASLLVLVVLLGCGAAYRMPTDIFPAINVPVVSVVWTYSGMTPTEIQNRILTLHERQMPALVDDIDHIEANSYQGVGVIKVYLHEQRRRDPGRGPGGQQFADRAEVHAAGTSPRRW